MKDTIELPTKYIITALKDGERHYYALDSQSGGYPYWTSFFSSAQPYNSIVDILSAWKEATVGSYMARDNVTEVQVGRVQTAIEAFVLPIEDIIAARKSAALSKLTDEEKELLDLV